MKFFKVKNLGPKHRWVVIHKNSGLQATCLGPLGQCKKVEALEWAKRAEKIAPTNDIEEAGKKLKESGYYNDWIKRALDKIEAVWSK